MKLANTKVVAAISTSASAPSDAASQSTENDSKKEVPPSKSNGFAFGLVVRFFTEEPGFSAKCIEHMCVFLSPMLSSATALLCLDDLRCFY